MSAVGSERVSSRQKDAIENKVPLRTSFTHACCKVVHYNSIIDGSGVNNKTEQLAVVFLISTRAADPNESCDITDFTRAEKLYEYLFGKIPKIFRFQTQLNNPKNFQIAESFLKLKIELETLEAKENSSLREGYL